VLCVAQTQSKCALAQVIPEEAVIVEEAASHRAAMQRYLPIRQSGGFYTMVSGGLGYGLPAHVGVVRFWHFDSRLSR
jgi:thiamine pyrophosphate-dependent acetolactate synthase large subunit-like protein